MFRAADCTADAVANRVRTIDLRLTSGTTAVHSDMLEYNVFWQKAISISRKTGIEFPDAYVSVLAEEHECSEIATFNMADFKKLGTNLHLF